MKKSKKWIWRNSSVKNKDEFETNLISGGEYEEKYKGIIGLFISYAFPYEIMYYFAGNDSGKKYQILQLGTAYLVLNNSMNTDYTTLNKNKLHYINYIVEDDNHPLLESLGTSMSEEQLVAQMASLGWERVSPEEYEEDKTYLLSL